MYSSLLLSSGWSHRLKWVGGKCGFPECGNSVCDLCQKCGMGIAAEEAGKLPRLHIQRNTQAISRVTCLCSNIFSVEADNSPMYLWRRRRIGTFVLGLSQSPLKEMDILIFVFVSRKSHIRPLSIFYVYILLLFRAKFYSRVVLCLISALLSQPKPTKVDVYK